MIKVTNTKALPEIVQLNERVFADIYDAPPYNLAHYREKLQNVEPLIFVATDEDRLVGNAISFVRGNSLYLWILAVDPLYQREGIGNQLLHEVGVAAKGLPGCTGVTVKVYNASPAMLRLLIYRGYLITATDRSVKGDKMNAIHLRLPLERI